MQVIYFDNNSTTKIAGEVLSKMNEAYALPLNASAVHQYGRKASNLIESVRQKTQNLLNAQNYEVIFTSSASEANNTVIFGAKVSKILICATEHASIYKCQPANKEIIEIKVLPNGLIDISNLNEELEKITNQDFLLSVSLANNETGVIQDIKEIAKLVHQKGGLIHSDIVQALGKIDVNLEDLNIDFASISAHKIRGPQGVGSLLVRKGVELDPLIYGAGQEKSKRAGTHNVAGIVGFGAALDLVDVKEFSKIEILRNFLEKSLKEIALDNVKFFGNQVKRLPNTSYIGLYRRDKQTQIINFDLNKICVSAGAACSSGTLNESRILKAMGEKEEFLSSAIRVSLGVENTDKEIKEFIRVWSEFYKKGK